MVKMVKKRPAAASADGEGNKVLKKPATWQEWSQRDDVEGSEDGGEAPEDSDVTSTKDTRPITKQQRHVFYRAMQTVDGIEGSLPEVIKNKVEELRASSQPGQSFRNL